VLGTELERGTWQLAWSQAVPRSRWLAVKLGLIMGALVVFGVAVTLILTWSRSPLDRVSIRLQPPPFNFEGIQLPCELLCGFGLAPLAGLLLRNTIGAMVTAYFAWQVPFVAGTLMTGPIHILTATTPVACAGRACTTASTNSLPPVTGNLGDLVLGITRSGGHLIVTYLPASQRVLAAAVHHRRHVPGDHKRLALLEASKPDVIRVNGARVNARRWREFLGYDPVPDYARITTPVLAITGGHDMQVPPEDVEAIGRLVQGPFDVRARAGAVGTGARTRASPTFA
jgi:pimeloyl-ACP methyl ester carboxylesterase